MGSETLAEKQRLHSGYELSEKGEACSRTGWAVLGSAACLQTNVDRGSETTVFTCETTLEGGHAPCRSIGACTKLLAEQQGREV